MKSLTLIFCLLLMGCSDLSPNDVNSDTQTSSSQADSFDAQAAWQDFEELTQLFYAYIDRDDFDVDAQLARSKDLALAAETDADFRNVLNQTAYGFTDPHFIVGPFKDDDYNIIPTSSDLKAQWKDGQLYIKDVRAGSAAMDAGIRPGWIVKTINGQDALSASKRPFGEVVRDPTKKQMNYGANLAVNGLRKSDRKIIFSSSEGDINMTLPSPRKFAFVVDDMPAMEISNIDDISIIRINNRLDDNDIIKAFDRAMNTVQDSQGLILDFRNTPSGGNTEVARSIIGHFITETRAYQVHEIPSLDREFTVPRRFIEQVKPREPFYGQPLVVIGGHWTGSMGEGLVIGLDAAAKAHTIASDMGDLLGAVNSYELTGSFAQVELGDESLFHVNGTPREDYVADQALEASDMDENGDDPALMAARAYLKNIID